MKKFWLVWCVSGNTPSVKHDSFESAAWEAERLAKANPDIRFEVMERISSVITPTVIWEGEQPLPF